MVLAGFLSQRFRQSSQIMLNKEDGIEHILLLHPIHILLDVLRADLLIGKENKDLLQEIKSIVNTK